MSEVHFYQCGECDKVYGSMSVFEHHECVSLTPPTETEGSAEPSTSHDTAFTVRENKDNEGGRKINPIAVWTTAPTKLLISMYKNSSEQLNAGKLRKKAFWLRVAKSLEGHGYSFSASQVEGRWKTLMNRYRCVKDSNNKSGNGTATFEFQTELDGLFGDKPNIKPEVTFSSKDGGKFVKKVVEKVKVCENGSDDDADTLDSEDDVWSKVAKIRKEDEEKEGRKKKGEKKRKTQAGTVIDFLKQKDEQTQQRHEDKLSIMKDMVNVLRDMAPTSKKRNIDED